MKKRFLASAALLLALCLTLPACGGGIPCALAEESAAAGSQPGIRLTSADGQESQVSVSAESPDRLLYRDDTLIVYTVKTPADCTEVIMSLLYRDYGLREQMATYTEQQMQELEEMDSAVLWAYNRALKRQSFTPQSDGVTVTEENGALVWMIPCDFGFTGAERVSAEAVCPTDDGMYPFGIVNVNIRYPSYNIIDEVETVMRAAMEYNLDEPMYFVCDLRATSVDFESLDSSDYYEAALFGLQRTTWEYADAYTAELEARLGTEMGVFWDYAAKDPEIYSGGLYMRWPYFAQIEMTPCSNTEVGSDLIPLWDLYVPEGEGVLLCGIRLGNEDPLLPEADPLWLQFMIDPGVRATVCYQAGVTANAEDFPSAAATQSGAEAALAQCIQPGMTDFEKAKAIFDWMYERSKTSQLPADFDSLSEAVQNLYYKTAYGFMTMGFGDCMGWSGAFTMLCRMAGIQCVNIDCAAEGGGAVTEPFNANHRINALWLDGELYFADTFWGAAGSGYSKPQYQFFLITSEQAAESYTWNGNLGIPESSATTYALDPKTGELLN